MWEPMNTNEAEDDEEFQIEEEEEEEEDRMNINKREIEDEERGGDIIYSAEDEKKVVNKVTLFLLPFLSVLYLLCFLDRANLGNAHQEMIKDLGISESEYGYSVSIFYIGYVLCEVPANCMMELVQARKWLARIMITWGIVSIAFSAVQSISSLLFLRLLLGIFEAGFFPGVVFYLTMWFTNQERAGKISILSSSSAFAGVVGGISAAFILQSMDGVFGLKAWRWIFIIEGIPSVIMGIVTLFYLPDTPQEAKWLTADEKTIISSRVHSSSSHLSSSHSSSVSRELTWKNFLAVFTLYVSEMKRTYKYLSLWIFGTICFFILVPMSSTPFFLQAVVSEFGSGLDPKVSNLLSAIPFFFAVILLNINSRHSDKTKERPFHIIAMCAIGIFGYILVLIGTINEWGPFGRMVAITIAVAGQWSAMTPFVAWISDNVQGNKAVAIAAVNSLGSIAGWAAPSIQSKCKEATGSYTLGLMVLGGSLICAILVVIAAKYHMLKVLQENKRIKPKRNKKKKVKEEMEVLVGSK